MDPSCLVSAVKFVPNEVAKECITFSCSQFTLQVWRKLELKLPDYFQQRFVRAFVILISISNSDLKACF